MSTIYDKHLEIFPYVLNNFHLFDKVLIYTTLKNVGCDYYVVLHCSIDVRYISWYIYKAKQETNFINIDIGHECKFIFKVPKKYQWYVPMIYRSGVKVIHPNHIHKFFVNENTPGNEELPGVFSF